MEPQNVAEAIALSAPASSRLIAGGSDLLGELKEGNTPYDRLVSLAGIDGLRGISRDRGSLRIGALTTVSELESSVLLDGPYRILASAAQGVATPEIRNQGTLGGNLCQRPRCLHYRHALVGCLKKGGEGCPAAETPHQDYLSIFGGEGCFAVSPSDMAPPLVALGASVTIDGPGGLREVPLESFFTGPDVDPARENVLGPGEIVTSILIPRVAEGWRGLYSKSRTRTAGDFAVVSLALGYELQGGRISNARVVLGGVAPAPLRSIGAEGTLDGNPPTESIARHAADAALAGATPLSHNAHKLDLAQALITRAVTRLVAV